MRDILLRVVASATELDVDADQRVALAPVAVAPQLQVAALGWVETRLIATNEAI